MFVSSRLSIYKLLSQRPHNSMSYLFYITAKSNVSLMLSLSLRNNNLKIIQLKESDQPGKLGILFKRAKCCNPRV